MVKHATGADRPGLGRRLIIVIGLAIALIIPFGYTFIQFWGSSGDDLEFTQTERLGVEYLRPLTRLVAVLSDAQAAAVRGQQPDTGVMQGALTAVANVDRRLGEQLDTRERWVGLSQRLNQLSQRKISGPEAYNAYTENMDLTMALVAKVGDSSNLILDPELDAYYLMDATLIRLPALITDSGRMVDLAWIGRRGDPNAALTQVAVARDRVASTAAALDVGLRKAFDDTASATLGPALLGHVDRLRGITSELAPATSLLDVQVSLDAAERAFGARERMRDAAIQLDDASLTELDALLDTREDGINRQRTGVLIAMSLALLIGGLVLWSRLPERDRGVEEEEDEFGKDRRQRRAEEPVHVGAGNGGTAESADLMDARDLLNTGEFVRVGRAVRPSRRERFRDDSE